MLHSDVGGDVVSSDTELLISSLEGSPSVPSRRRWAKVACGAAASAMILATFRGGQQALPRLAHGAGSQDLAHSIELSSAVSIARRGNCTDDPSDWRSSRGLTCEQYARLALCTSAGGHGRGWDERKHGRLEDVGSGGLSALRACCACGGGGPSRAPAPPTAPALVAVTLSGSASRMRGGRAQEFVPAAALDDVLAFDDASLPSDACSWDFMGCFSSQCCRGYGMQCYRKGDKWAACKASCTPGADPFDWDKTPWSCEMLGARMPGPASDETCNRVRVGGNIWNGKTFAAGDAQSAETCETECKSTPWCEVWSWSGANGGQCLLGEHGMGNPGLGAAPSAAKCRLASGDLPAQGCSETGQDCFQSRCCTTIGDQCFKKDEGYAECLPHCPTGQGWNCEKFGIRLCPACRPLIQQRPAIVVPTFERDLCKSVVLAKSIAKYDPDNLLGDVFLLWVSEEAAWRHDDKIDEIRQAVEAGGTKKFHLLDFSQQVQESKGQCVAWNSNGTKCITHFLGWHAQQSLKLKVAKLVSSEYYLLLDSKNAFVRNVEKGMFFSPCNQAFVQGKYRYDDLPLPHKGWYDKSAAHLGIDPDKDIWWPTSVTPAVLHTATVLELLVQLGEDANPYQICNGPLCQLFGQECTEFTLYNVFAFAKPNRECIHSFEGPSNTRQEISVSLWRESPYVNLELCEEVSTGNMKALTFGLQSGCLGSMANLSGSRGEKSGAWLWRRTRDCVARVYSAAGLADNSLLSDSERDTFADCVS